MVKVDDFSHGFYVGIQNQIQCACSHDEGGKKGRQAGAWVTVESYYK